MRLDKRGRRIGYNWWREYNMAAFNAAWFDRDEREGDNHQMEPDEFVAENPKPQLKTFLIANAGMQREPEEAA